MDFIILSSIVGMILLSLTLSYDIACQWYKRFLKWLKAMPPHLQFKKMLIIQYKVPKFHLPAHCSECYSCFSFNFTPGAAHTDGKGVEHNWSWLNCTAASTSQMGLGSRMDSLDNFMNFSNYRKGANLGMDILNCWLQAQTN